MRKRYYFLMLFFLVLMGIISCAEQLDDNKTAPNSFVSAREIDSDDIDVSQSNIDCPVGLINGLTLEEEFGLGASEITRCLDEDSDVLSVYPLNRLCKTESCESPYAVGNINNAINDYEITNGLMLHEDYDITAIIYSTGALFAIDNNAAIPFPEQNPFQTQIEELLVKGVHIYLCQNTARAKGIRTENLIQGIKFVTSGVTAIADLQLKDYALVQP